jgi:hypothetical protein
VFGRIVQESGARHLLQGVPGQQATGRTGLLPFRAPAIVSAVCAHHAKSRPFQG